MIGNQHQERSIQLIQLAQNFRDPADVIVHVCDFREIERPDGVPRRSGEIALLGDDRFRLIEGEDALGGLEPDARLDGLRRPVGEVRID